MSNKIAFIWSKSNIVNYFIIQSNCFLFKMQFIPVMAKLIFQQPLLQSSVSHDPSEITEIMVSFFPLYIFLGLFDE